MRSTSRGRWKSSSRSLAEDAEERAQQRRMRLYIIIGVAAAILILAFAVVAAIFG
jgi:hypothetical protein